MPMATGIGHAHWHGTPPPLTPILLTLRSKSCSGGDKRIPCFPGDDYCVRYFNLQYDLCMYRLLAARLCVDDNHMHLLAKPPAAGRIGRMM